MILNNATLTLKLVNNLTKKSYIIDNLVENANSTDIFYCLDIQLPADILDGEYTYFLYQDGYLLVQGICQIGDYTPEQTRFNNDSNEVIVFEG